MRLNVSCNVGNRRELGNSSLLALGKGYGGAKFVVTSEGDPAARSPLNSDPLIKEKWKNYFRGRLVPDDAVMGQCSISGKYGRIARIHDNLTGIRGGLATGANIVLLKSRPFGLMAAGNQLGFTGGQTDADMAYRQDAQIACFLK